MYFPLSQKTADLIKIWKVPRVPDNPRVYHEQRYAVEEIITNYYRVHNPFTDEVMELMGISLPQMIMEVCDDLRNLYISHWEMMIKCHKDLVTGKINWEELEDSINFIDQVRSIIVHHLFSGWKIFHAPFILSEFVAMDREVEYNDEYNEHESGTQARIIAERIVVVWGFPAHIRDK